MIDWWFSIIWNPGDRPVTVWTGQHGHGDRRDPYTRQNCRIQKILGHFKSGRPRGLMDMASDFGSED